MDITTLNAVSAIAAPIAYTGLRVATGSFFVLSGFHKLFNKARHAGLVSTLTADGIPAVPVMQWFVPAVEFSAGLGVTFGAVTPLAALGLFAICAVATCTDGLGRIGAWKPIDRADYVDDVLYLPEVIYAAILAMLVVTGAGPYSVDAIACAYLGI
jgi:uncharacterized membrane protein YphA (DoxX/SURF4 family)